MNKLWKFFQYGYLVVGFICLVEGVVRWSEERSRAYLFLGFAALTIFMFFFKRHFRKKVEKRNSQNQ
ncbi:hypothetical protein PI23P_01687 [Polaribacter irgensii 23-P]|jgi:membrane protein implicated in regulation of membrane protease activity|uniref:Uncharacterized protein n=1 Tax=Polaribacter irgensii 23-P TaxID=313594 RepID=A4BW24_9FLAO|nr:hypothetical protein [Polaribacter irgensii]EAR13165.1 hypothetical protein PI23P_01687 [Polaribacter irgensii 23-P]